MMLLWMILIFFAAGLLAWMSDRWGARWPRCISLVVLSGHMAWLIVFWGTHFEEFAPTRTGPWLVEFEAPWIPQLGIGFSMAMDGLSFLLIVLSNLLAIIGVGCSWDSVRERVGFFHFNLLWLLAALVGVFVAMDLVLFFVFWEMMLVPLYLLIAIWGHENRIYAAVKFFIFTQAGGLLMLLSILALYLVHGSSTGEYTFDYRSLLGTELPEATAWWLMLGFFVAFIVKLPAFPLHTWLPDAHTEAPTAGSVILAGLVLKAGAYGLLRFAVPLFPQASLQFAPVGMALGVIGILYGAVMAFGQVNLKRLVAYTSISHMGFVLLGVFAGNEYALQGAVVVMLAHGISTSALFVLVGDLYERVHTFDMDRLGGLWSSAPRMGGVGLLFALASLGLPGLGNFVGEFLVLLGVYQENVVLACFAVVGMIVSAVYSLWIVQRVFHGEAQQVRELADMTLRETAVLGMMTVAIIWLGLFPQTALETGRGAVDQLQTLGRTVHPTAGVVGKSDEDASRKRSSPDGSPGPEVATRGLSLRLFSDSPVSSQDRDNERSP